MSRQPGLETPAELPGGALDAPPPHQVVAQLYALAVAQQKAGSAAAAIQTYQRCLLLSPRSPEIHNNLGTALDQAGRLPEAAQCFQHALDLDPSYVRPLINLGKVLRLQGKPSEAVASVERALSFSPDNPSALTNLGFALADLGRRQDAIRALRRACELDPTLAEAHHGLGRVLLDSGGAAGALVSLERAVVLKPALLDACLLLATALLALHRLPEALQVVAAVLQRAPDSAEALAAGLNCSLKLCDWRTVARILERIRTLDHGTSHTQPFLLMAVSDDPEEHLEAARLRAATVAGDRVALPPPATWKHDRIRVAYVSGDFYTHATSFLLAEVLELHDRSAFEVFGVSFGPDDQSPLRRRVLAAFDQCLDARDRSDLEIATWLREHEIDIAVDLKGYTAYCRPGIFAHRPAPIQVNYLGYPGTMAAPFIDYLIADPFVIPEAERSFYTEEIIYLPGCYQPNDRQRLISPHIPTRREMALPEEGFVFCCFNNSWKITARVFDVWMRLLAGVPGSVLWLLEDNPSAVENLRREADARAIAPERLVFCGRVSNEAHLARHRLADLFLDTFPYNAHTTASDALWTGLPVVTFAGRTFASRVAGSLLHAVGLPDLVTTSLEEYEHLASKVASNPGHLAALRATLTSRPEALPLFDTPALCKHLESAYRHMLLLRSEGKPETLAVTGFAPGGA
jgi:predicted O-linked N-acetylglucosamine transferase (SPINDLY family)